MPVMVSYTPVRKFCVESVPQLSFFTRHKAEVKISGLDRFKPLNPYFGAGNIDFKGSS